MALEMLIDTYVTIAQADQYVKEHYLSNEPLRITWEGLEEADKEVYLRRAFEKMNSLPYSGRRKNLKQTLPFPRYVWCPSDWGNVQRAQIIIAVSATDIAGNTESAEIEAWKLRGLSEVKLGDATYKFASGSAIEGAGSYYGLPKEAYLLLRKWLSGGYDICSTKTYCGR